MSFSAVAAGGGAGLFGGAHSGSGGGGGGGRGDAALSAAMVAGSFDDDFPALSSSSSSAHAGSASSGLNTPSGIAPSRQVTAAFLAGGGGGGGGGPMPMASSQLSRLFQQQQQPQSSQLLQQIQQQHIAFGSTAGLPPKRAAAAAPPLLHNAFSPPGAGGLGVAPGLLQSQAVSLNKAIGNTGGGAFSAGGNLPSAPQSGQAALLVNSALGASAQQPLSLPPGIHAQHAFAVNGGGIGGGFGGGSAAATTPAQPQRSPPSLQAGSGAGGPLSASNASAAGSAGSAATAPPGDRFGLVGLIDVIRMTDPDMNMLALGCDLTTLGLNLNSPDSLCPSFMSAFSDTPMDGAEPHLAVPPCYRLPSETVPFPLSRIPALPDETLFYAFYSFSRDAVQEAAAQELYNRAWRYHKERRIWITKEAPPPAGGADSVSPSASAAPATVAPSVKTALDAVAAAAASNPAAAATAQGQPLVDRGVFIYFDPVLWQKVKSVATVNLDALEERASPISAAAAADGTAATTGRADDTAAENDAAPEPDGAALPAGGAPDDEGKSAPDDGSEAGTGDHEDPQEVDGPL
ncbi:hypothetical protein HK405_014100, partial [Cladochytrium tenue]